MKKVALALVLLLVSVTYSLAANINIDGLPAAPSVAGSDLYECEQGGTNRKCTPAQLSTYITSLISGDCTLSANVITCLKSNGVPFAPSATTDATNATNITSGTLAKPRLPSPFTTATLSGNTSVLGTVSGVLTAGDCVKFDASSNLVDAGAACGTGGGGGTPGGSNTQVQYNALGSFAGITGATSNGTVLTLVAPVLGTPASGTLTNTTGLPISTGLSGAGTGVLTALGVNIGSAGAPVLLNGALGTPTSGSLANLAGLPIATGVSGLAANVATFLATPSSANLAAALTDKTGTGSTVFGTAPSISSPTIATAATLGFLTSAGTQCVQVSSTGAISGTGSACGGSGSTGGNPTATASDAAVNGVASTFMRSDAAPAIQKASASQFGLVEVDNTTVVASGGVISFNAAQNVQSGTSYTVLSTDKGKIIQFTNAAAVSVTIPIASAVGFGSSFYTTFQCLGVGGCTLTPTTSTIDGGLNLTLPQFQSVDLISNGTNYTTLRGRATGASVGSPNTWTAAQTFGTVIGTVTIQAGTTYTLTSTDCGTTVRFTSASAVTVTIPQGLPVGCSLAVEQAGAGAVSVNGSAVTPATLHSSHSFTKTFGQWAVIGIFTESSNVAILTGDGV